MKPSGIMKAWVALQSLGEALLRLRLEDRSSAEVVLAREPPLVDLQGFCRGRRPCRRLDAAALLPKPYASRPGYVAPRAFCIDSNADDDAVEHEELFS